jgi:endonuclease/exonuclease/phosphatase family metal-dependent hydrolase
LSALAQYGSWILQFIPELKVDLNVPIVLMGDFNMDVTEHKEYAEFFEKYYKLQHHPFDSTTTLGCTRIDHAFLRNINTECMAYISYFSYHRPLLHKITEKAPIKAITYSKDT